MDAKPLPDQTVREAYEMRDAKISYAGRRGMNSFADVEKALMDCAVAVGYPVESTAEDFDVVGVIADMVGSVVRERDRLQHDIAELTDARDEALQMLCMTQCPAYKDNGVCSSGCYQEPACQCDEPTEGWIAASIERLAPASDERRNDG